MASPTMGAAEVGFRITALPAARAATAGDMASWNGKFQGEITATTPRGLCRTRARRPGRGAPGSSIGWSAR